MSVPTYAAAADHGIARIPLEEALSGRLLDDLAAIFGGTAARDRYIARLLAGARPGSGYLGQWDGGRLTGLAWLGRHRLCGERGTWLLDVLRGNGADRLRALLGAALTQLARHRGRSLVAEYEPDGDEKAVCREVRRIGGAVTATETYYRLPIADLLRGAQPSVRPDASWRFDPLGLVLRMDGVEPFYRFLADLYRDVPHAYRLSALTPGFVKAYFPVDQLSLEVSMVGRHHGAIRAAFLVERGRAREPASIVAALVDPACRGQGLAGLMRTLAARRLAAHDVEEMTTLVQDGHDAVLNAYRAVGARAVGRRCYFRLAGAASAAGVDNSAEDPAGSWPGAPAAAPGSA